MQISGQTAKLKYQKVTENRNSSGSRQLFVCLNFYKFYFATSPLSSLLKQIGITHDENAEFQVEVKL